MKRKRRRPAPRRADRPPIEDHGPTPETVAHAQAAGSDPLEKLAHDGVIDSAGERACEEIRRVWEALTHELQPKRNKFSNTAKGLREMPDSIAEAYSERYKPWWIDTYPACELVIRLVVDRVGTKSPSMLKDIGDCIANYARRL